MKAKLVKIILVTAVIAFFSAGVSMAQDWKGDRRNGPKAKAYSHYKQDNKNHHKFQHNRHFQKSSSAQTLFKKPQIPLLQTGGNPKVPSPSSLPSLPKLPVSCRYWI